MSRRRYHMSLKSVIKTLDEISHQNYEGVHKWSYLKKLIGHLKKLNGLNTLLRKLITYCLNLRILSETPCFHNCNSTTFCLFPRRISLSILLRKEQFEHILIRPYWTA